LECLQALTSHMLLGPASLRSVLIFLSLAAAGAVAPSSLVSSRIRRLSPRCPDVQGRGQGGPLEVTQASRDVYDSLGVLSWNAAAIGEGSCGTTTAFGDTFKPMSSSVTLSESLLPGNRRYVLSGRGKLTVASGGKTYTVQPNTLVEAVDAADIEWSSTGGMVLGIPEDESAARVAARNAAPYVGGALIAIGLIAVASEALS